MKKGMVWILFLAIWMGACQKEPDPQSLRREIAENREKIIRLKQQNEALQKRLDILEEQNGTRAVAVEVEQIMPQTFTHHFEVNGSVEAVKESYVSTQTPGQIQQIHVREGDRVQKDDLLISLNSDVLRNNIAEVRTHLQLATTVYEKRRDLWSRQIGSEVEFLSAKNQKESLENRLKALEAQLDMTRITSPIEGIVDRIPLKKGELASPGQLLVLVVNLREVYINADVSERYLDVVRVGDLGEVTFPSVPDLKLEVPIHKIGQVINSENRTFKIQLKIPNRRERLKPNLIAVVRLTDYVNESAMVVPSIVIKKDLQGTYVYRVEEKEGQFQARKAYVHEGISSENRSIITFGLEFGDRVVTRGYNFIKDGTTIEIK